jgi:hypothetical protein
MDPAIHLALRFSFALLLAVSAWHKLRDVRRFRDVIADYDVLPAAFSGAAAVSVTAAELLSSLALATGLAVAAGGAGAASLFILYAAAIYANVARGRTGIDCGCMGPAARVPLSGALAIRNVALAATAAMLLVPAIPRPMTWADVASALAATAALSACWLASERLLALAPRAAVLRARKRP